MSSKAKWRQYTKEQLQEICNKVYSYRELGRQLGYKPDGGGTMRSLHNMVDEL